MKKGTNLEKGDVIKGMIGMMDIILIQLIHYIDKV